MLKLKNIGNGKAELILVTEIPKQTFRMLFDESNTKRKESMEKDLDVEIRCIEGDLAKIGVTIGTYFSMEVVKVLENENDLDKTIDQLIDAQRAILCAVTNWKDQEDQTQQNEPDKKPELVKKVMDMMDEKKYITIIREGDGFHMFGNIHPLEAIKMILTAIRDHEDA